MTESLTRGRHRSALRPKTPLTAITDTFSCSAAHVGRRAGAVAAASGLVLSIPMAANAAELPVGTIDPSAASTGMAEAMQAVSVPTQVQVTTGDMGFTAGAAVQTAADSAARTTRGASRSEARAATTTTTKNQAASTATTPAPVPVSSSGLGSTIVEIASRYVGVPYVYGGTTPAGFDCSGFVQYVYAQVGISLPRTSGAQKSAGTRVSYADAQPGDIVGFSYGHVGIYAGNGMMYDAAHPGVALRYRPVPSGVFFVHVPGV